MVVGGGGMEVGIVALGKESLRVVLVVGETPSAGL